MSSRIKHIAMMAVCVVLCWALVVVPCLHYVGNDFAKELGYGMGTPMVYAPAPSVPVSGSASFITQGSDIPDADLFGNSNVITSIPADKITGIIQGYIDPDAAAGKAPSVKPPVTVVPPVNDTPDKESETVKPITPDTSVNGNGNSGFYGDYALLTQPDGSTFIYYDQTWDAYKSYKYGTATIGGYGCGPTSMAMVVSNLTSHVVKPTAMADWAAGNGYFVSGRGTAYGLFPAVASMYGFSCTTISSSDKNAVVSALKEGKLLITIVNRGDFSVGRHFLLIRGITDDGKLLVADSGNYDNCHKPWDYNRVIGQIVGGQFWVFG